MPDYSQGKIYKIEPLAEHPEEDIYIGSTTQKYLSDRFSGHRRDYKRFMEGKKNYTSSYDLFQKYGVENCNIYLLEHFNAKDRSELEAKEGQYIQKLKCINKIVSGRSKQQYRKDKRDEINNHKKKMYAMDRARIIQKQKQYAIEHKETVQEYQRMYREKTKTQRADANTQYRMNNSLTVECPCGSSIKIYKMRDHIKTQKHRKYMETIKTEPLIDKYLIV